METAQSRADRDGEFCDALRREVAKLERCGEPAAAEALGITRQQLYRVINGTSAVTPEMAFPLKKSIGSTADTWLRMQTAYDLAQLRLREPSIRVKKLASKVA